MLKFLKKLLGFKEATVQEVAPYKVEVSQENPLDRAVEPIAAGTVTPEIVVERAKPTVKPSKKPATKNPAVNKSRGRKPKPKTPATPKAQ